MTARVIITGALRDISELRTGQTTSPDLLADCFNELNQMIDEWALERVQVWQRNGLQLDQFGNIDNDYTFAAGMVAALRKNLAVRVLPLAKLHLKGQPELDQVKTDAARAFAMLLGVGPS